MYILTSICVYKLGEVLLAATGVFSSEQDDAPGTLWYGHYIYYTYSGVCTYVLVRVHVFGECYGFLLIHFIHSHCFQGDICVPVFLLGLACIWKESE